MDRMTQTRSRAVRLTLLSDLSRTALADLVVDLVRRCEGDEELDGEPLLLAVLEAYAPVAAARGETVPAARRDALEEHEGNARRRAP